MVAETNRIGVIMLKYELIKALENFDDDAPVVIGDAELGWCNIDEVKNEKGTACIMQDYSRPFTSDN